MNTSSPVVQQQQLAYHHHHDNHHNNSITSSMMNYSNSSIDTQLNRNTLSSSNNHELIYEEKSVSKHSGTTLVVATPIATSTTATNTPSIPKNVEVRSNNDMKQKQQQQHHHHTSKLVMVPTKEITKSSTKNISSSNGSNLDEKHRRTVKTESNVSIDTASTGIISNDSSTMTNSTAPFMEKKQVQFLKDKKGHVHCTYYRNREPKTKQETLDSFYQMNDFMSFRRECKHEAMIQQKSSSYKDNFAKVYAACSTGNFKSVTRERAYISAASCRGLEVVLFPTLHSDRKMMIATVLKTQKSLPSTMKYTERCEAIASASRYLSQQSRQLARVFGSGDAAVVIASQRIDSLQQQQQLEKNKKEQGKVSPPRLPSPYSTSRDSDAYSPSQIHTRNTEEKHEQQQYHNNNDTVVKQARRKSTSSSSRSTRTTISVPQCFVSC